MKQAIIKTTDTNNHIEQVRNFLDTIGSDYTMFNRLNYVAFSIDEYSDCDFEEGFYDIIVTKNKQIKIKQSNSKSMSMMSNPENQASK